MADLVGRAQRVRPFRRPEIAAARSLTIIATLGIVAALYFAKPILLPLALAVLLTFVLAPPVRVLRSWGLGRVPSVALVVVCAFLVIAGIGLYLGQQVTDLAGKLPQYQYVVQEKIQSVIDATSGGTLERLSGFLDRLNQELVRKDTHAARPGASPENPPAVQPTPVEITQPTPTPIQVLQQVLPPLLDPLLTIGLVTIFVIFFLLQRRDLRDRLIRLAGSHDLKRITAALDDAARRLSRYFLVQTALNALFGVIVALGLGVIGVPNPILWGVSGMILRFVPYVGAVLAAAFPVALAIAVGPDWSMALWTVALFVVVEPLIGQVLEPLAYGHSTGLSPVAVIIAATFWTWLWGPVGLLLSTPITVCLSVLGRHIEWLGFLDILIGGDAPLTEAQRFYQRALAGDSDEVVDQATQVLKSRSLLDYYDDIVLQGLLLAEIDIRRGLLGEDDVRRINETTRALVEDLAEWDDVTPSGEASKSEAPVRLRSENDAPVRPDLPVLQSGDLSPAWAAAPAVACVAGRGAFDETIAAILVQLLDKHGLKSDQDNGALSSTVAQLNAATRMACVSSLNVERGAAQLRNLIRRIRRRLPQAQIVAGIWGHEAGEGAAPDMQASIGADFCAYSLRQGIAYLLEAARGDQGLAGASEDLDARSGRNRGKVPAA